MIRETYESDPTPGARFLIKKEQEVPEVEAFLAEFFALCEKHDMWIHQGHWEDTDEDYAAIDQFSSGNSVYAARMKLIREAFVKSDAMNAILAKRAAGK